MLNTPLLLEVVEETHEEVGVNATVTTEKMNEIMRNVHTTLRLAKHTDVSGGVPSSFNGRKTKHGERSY